MTPEQLGVYAGIALSLALFYVPGLSDAYNALAPQKQAGVMALLLLGVAAAIFGLSCASWYVTVSCDVAGAKQLVNVYVAALIANQATYTIAVRPVKRGRSLGSQG